MTTPLPAQGSTSWYPWAQWLDGQVRNTAGYSDEQVRDVVAAMVKAGANVTVTNDDGANTLTISAAGGTGTGAVSSVNGETGAVVLDAADVGAQPAGSYAAASHAHTAAQVGAVQAITANLKLWSGKQIDFDAIGTKDGNTVYVVVG